MGRRSITDWRKKLTIGAPQAFLDKFLKDRVREAKWSYPIIDGLRGEKYQGLSELRWKCGRPHRIIGYTLSIPKVGGKKEEQHAGIFVMLIGCQHNGKKYYPTECLDSAVARKKEIEQGKATTIEYILPIDR